MKDHIHYYNDKQGKFYFSCGHTLTDKWNRNYTICPNCGSKTLLVLPINDMDIAVLNAIKV